MYSSHDKRTVINIPPVQVMPPEVIGIINQLMAEPNADILFSPNEGKPLIVIIPRQVKESQMAKPIKNLKLMCGSCHFDKASNDKFSVEF